MQTSVPLCKSLRYFVLALLLGVFALVPTARAQETIFQAKVPFAFMVGDIAMPAGNYLVTVYAGNNLMIVNKDTGKSIMPIVQTQGNATEAHGSSARFVRFGNEYFLDRLVVNGDTQGYRCPAGKRRQELTRLDKTRHTAEEVTLASVTSLHR